MRMSDFASFDPHAASVEPPYEVHAELRRVCPVVETKTGWFVGTYEGVKSALQRVDTFTGVGGSYFDTSNFPEDEIALPNLPEPQHSRVRKIVNGALARHKASDIGPFVRTIAEDLLDEALQVAQATGSVDLMTSFVAPIPSRVVARALGIPVEDTAQFQRWADELVQRVWDADPAPLSKLHPDLATYIQSIIDQRRAGDGTGNDFLSRMMEVQADGRRLTDASVRTNALNLISGGTETTASLISHCLYQLATDPELFNRLRRERSDLPNLIEEALRVYSPLQALDRNVQEDAVIEGTAIPACARIVIGIASANRDEKVYQRPDEFRLDRPKPSDHLAFGAGRYICPGAFLARLQALTTIDVFLDRVFAVSLVDGYTFDGNPLYWARTLSTLPVYLESEQ
jgi:hypothetical protein